MPRNCTLGQAWCEVSGCQLIRSTLDHCATACLELDIDLLEPVSRPYVALDDSCFYGGDKEQVLDITKSLF